MPGKRKPQLAREHVPLFGSWRNAYLAVAIAFVLDVLSFYFFSVAFS